MSWYEQTLYSSGNFWHLYAFDLEMKATLDELKIWSNELERLDAMRWMIAWFLA